MKKILSILNVSNRENIGSDSGVIFHSLLFPECQKKGYEVVIAAPFEIKIHGAEYVFMESGKNKYDVRFRFDWDAYSELIKKTEPDIIFCHQVEQCANIRTLLVSLGLSQKIKLITYYHYLPAMELAGDDVVWDPSLNHEGLAEIIFLKVLSALKSSDLFFVTSEYSKKFLTALAKKYNFSFDSQKIVVMPPPADPFFELKTPLGFKDGQNTVLYSSRLYEQYGTDFLIEIIEHYKNSNVRFIVTDFFSNKSAERKKLDTKTEQYREFLRNQNNVIIRGDGDNRQVYRDEIIANASLVLGPYRKNANWSMSMIDAFMMGIPGIGPNCASFPEFMPAELIYDNKEDAIYLIDKLLSEKDSWERVSKKCRNSYQRFMPSETASIFFGALEQI
jgi:glycosyltransferase involved in cell wall biosynthesis